MRLSVPKNKFLLIFRIVILIIATGLIIYSVIGFWHRYRVTHAPTPSITAEAVTYTTDTPKEAPPDCDSFHVADDEPRKIQISSVDISGCIQKVNTDQNGAIAAPNNIHLAGWYTQSVLPGQPGLSIIDGHVMGKYSTAIFTNLKNISAGDEIQIEMGDGSKKLFTVVDSHNYAVDQVTNNLFNRIDGVDNQLTLITCSGNFNRGSQTYNERLIIRAKLE